MLKVVYLFCIFLFCVFFICFWFQWVPCPFVSFRALWVYVFQTSEDSFTAKIFGCFAMILLLRCGSIVLLVIQIHCLSTLLLIKIVSIKHWSFASGLEFGAFVLIFSHILDLFFSSYIRVYCKLLTGMNVLCCCRGGSSI